MCVQIVCLYVCDTRMVIANKNDSFNKETVNPRHWVSNKVLCLFFIFLMFKEKNVQPAQWVANKLLYLRRRKTKKLCTADVLGPK